MLRNISEAIAVNKKAALAGQAARPHGRQSGTKNKSQSSSASPTYRPTA